MSTREDVMYYGPECLSWSLEDTSNNDVFYEEFQKTPVGQEIIKAGLKNTDNLYEVIGLAQQRAGRVEITLREAEAAAKELFLDGDLKPKTKPVAQAPAPKPLTEPQKRWSEYREFSERSTSAQCTARARVDSGYASFMRKNYERELGATPVGDAVVSIGTEAVRQDKSIRINDELRAFADAYRRTSTSEVKRMSSPGSNPFRHKQYTDLLDACIASGLI
jgi:hypothetical protein